MAIHLQINLKVSHSADLSGNRRFFHWLASMMVPISYPESTGFLVSGWSPADGAVLTRDVTEIWRIGFTRHISHKLIVNVNVSKMAFTQKKTRLNREGGIYGNSRRHSQPLRDYVSELDHVHKGFGFSYGIETAAAKRLQKPEAIHQR